MPRDTHDWPAEHRHMAAARQLFLTEAPGRPLIVPDGDVDGLSAGILVWRAVERLGGAPRVLHPGKGEHVHSDAVRVAIRKTGPGMLVVVDMGSRRGVIDESRRTLIIDHHQPRGFPPKAVVVSAFGHPPVATTSWLTWSLLREIAPIEDCAWIAALGAAADLGATTALDGVQTALTGHARKDVSEAIALLNAPRRSAGHDVSTAFQVLLAAKSPREIARGTGGGIVSLRRSRSEVAAEVARCSRTAPKIAGPFALIAFSSPAKVHPLVARRWRDRLKDKVVIAANRGYLPGRVNFAMRSALPVNLIEVLERFPFPRDSETAHGHPAATGGSLTEEDFDALVRAMGFGGGPAPKYELDFI